VVVVNPPAEITVVNVGDEEYGYANGAYYEAEEPVDEESDPTFKVVTPPIGATVTELPEDAAKETVGDTEYFVYADTWYQPFYNGATAVYVVVEKPA
jgi:hypothetical protein